jgi:hypothetical protein
MSNGINANGPEAYREITVTAQPERISVGGTVLLTAQVPQNTQGRFTVEWTVEGPVHLSLHDTRVALLGATTVKAHEVNLPEDGYQFRATLDTSTLTVGSWRVGIRLASVVPEGEEIAEGGGDDESEDLTGESDPIEVTPRPFAAGDGVAVTLQRAAAPPTSDQALWVAIRNSTNALGFENYSRFIEAVVCGERSDQPCDRQLETKRTKHTLRKVKRRTALPFPNVDRYRLLKAATEVFLMIHCGVDLGDFTNLDLDEESRRLNRPVQPGDLEAQLRDYLTQVSTGHGEFLDVLPYLGLIRLKLGDVPIVGSDGDDEAQICYGILAEKLANPCFLELLWSYWQEEGHLVHAMNAISWRFQNRSSARPGRDPLAGLDIDPLRPLNNLLWGYIQDQQHRLTTRRRAYEYDHHYGLALASTPRLRVRGADSRSRFIEAFHNLLSLCWEFYKEDDDTTVIADGFSVLNALKETHLLLTEGAHNQYGDLPWTARHEMLMQQWILARPEMREFLPSRIMVAHPEEWMAPMDAMNKLQGWSDTSVLHFRDLAVFGEQLLLGIRFGAWTVVIDPEQGANWARYWRPEVKGYMHAYRAVTGIDLIQRRDTATPGTHLRRRYGAYSG